MRLAFEPREDDQYTCEAPYVERRSKAYMESGEHR